MRPVVGSPPDAPGQPASRIAGLLADELAALQEFVDLLKTEQDVLVKGRADELTALVAKKTALTLTLSEQARQRDAALTACRLPTGREGMEAWLRTNQTAANDWAKLLPLVAEARKLNELNGKLIGTRLQHNQQALTALLSATERATTYGPDGQTSTTAAGNTGRMLGSA